jgi:hypothetical protein
VNKLERAAMVRLIDSLGADVLVNLTPPPEMSRAARLKARAEAATVVDNCTSCGLCDHRRPKDDIGPRYAETSWTAATSLIIVTEFPCDSHHRKLIRSALSMSEFVDVDRLAWVPVVGCRPRTDEGTLRRPSAIERKACEFNFMTAMTAANAPLVLLVGAGAVSAWRSDVRIEHMRGLVGVWRDMWSVAAVETPDVVNRREGATLRDWMRTVVEAVDLLHGDMLSGMGTRCLDKKCTEPVFGWDKEAMPWCKRHLEVKATKRPREHADQALPWGEGEAL